jgi:hypothetical protein
MFFSFLAAPLLLTGCIMESSPPSPFSDLENAHALNGLYRNCADSRTAQPRYLSAVLWPNDTGIPHNKIDFISVKTTSGNTLVVQALSGPRVVVKRRYREGTDFIIKHGRIHLKRELSLSAATPVDNPYIGLISNSISLGIDCAGHGKTEQTTRVLGTAFLIIPVAGQIKEELRFQRVEDESTTNLFDSI